MIARTDRHGPIRFKSYREIHETVMNQFVSRDFVKNQTLAFSFFPYGIRLKGEISCLGGIVVTVDKFLDILNEEETNPLVQTLWYAYNASVRDHGNILRYDNQDDEYLREGHLDEHHKHLFDWRTGQEMGNSPVWIGRQGWLTLGDVLQEIQDWYWHHRSELPNPDEYPEIGLR